VKDLTHRRIQPNVLRHARRLAGRVVEDVPKDTRARSFVGEVASSAHELQPARLLILLRIQHIAALTAETEGDLFQLRLLVSRIVIDVVA
jgi:hypothetical protein